VAAVLVAGSEKAAAHRRGTIDGDTGYAMQVEQ
jgi:hypothetical protein